MKAKNCYFLKRVAAALLFTAFIHNISFSQGTYVINGSATNDGNGCFTLTPNAGNQSGSVWYQNFMTLNSNFDFTFNVFLGYNDGGADGIAFVLQPNSTGAGSAGGGLGYEGISPSIAVEYDTWQNADPFYDHIAVQRNGNVNTTNAALAMAPAIANQGNIEDGQFHTTRIVWNASTKNLKVYFDGNLRIDYSSDFVNNTFNGNPNVYWGFTGATGGAQNLQRVCMVSTDFKEAPSINIASTKVACPGANDGTATATFSGGTSPYTFLGWSNGSMSTTITNLAPGTYTASMKDANNITATKSVIITATNFDLDGDGFSYSPACGIYDDCNDNDRTVYPGAPELCDKKDNNCDGVIPANEIDSDGDGYSPCQGDCNDSNPSIKPNATEVVGNNIDDNCDGLVDVLPYCTPTASSPTLMWISNVKLGTINNTSGLSSSGYSNYTAMSTQLNPGNTYSISVSGANYEQSASVYIDWNRDGDFNDAGETIASGVVIPASGPGVANIAVPANANGTYRMRVRTEYRYSNPILNACSSVVYGEAEDYTIKAAPTVVAPLITCPSNISVQSDAGKCGAIVAFAATATGTTPTISYSHVPGTLFPVGVTTVTGTATNTAGTSTCTFTVEVKDVEAPSLVNTTPTDITVSCSDVPAAPSVSASDNCDANPVVTLSAVSTKAGDPSVSGHYNYTITHTWKATDAAGNEAVIATQVVTVQDVTAPSITVPANVTVSCQDDNSSDATGVATASDNCSPVIITQSQTSTQNSDVNSNGQYNYTITRTWTATDISGNATSASQLIMVQDIIKPSLVVPANAIVNCQDDQSSTATGIATASDNCSPVSVTQSDASTQNPDPNSAGYYNYTINRTWTAKDVSGNTETAVQIITVQDVTKPVITVPANIMLDCQDNTAPSATGVATATDNCGPVAISHSDASTQNSNTANVAHYNYSIARTWTATDASGNAISGIQTITVQDVTKPVVTTKNVTVTLVNGTAAINVSSVNDGTTDNCSPLTFTLSKSSFNCTNLGSNTVTLTATDVSGNSASATAVVTVVGVIPAPSISVSRTNATFTGNGTNKTIFIGYGAQNLTLSAANGTSTQGNTQYSWSPAAHLNTTSGATTVYTPTPGTVGHNNITVTATNEFGCVKNEIVTITVVDARCGNNLDKVNVCHVGHGNLLHENTICVSANAVATHLNAGCKLNECGADAPTSVNGRATGASQNGNGSLSDVDALTINVAPNPTTRHFRISVESSNTKMPAQVKVYNLNGKLLETKQNVAINSVSEIGANYIPGVYIVEVWQGNQRRQLKLIKLAE